MSMPRDPVFVTSEPSHNLIPAAGGAVWIPLHDDSFLPGITGLPTMTEVGTPSGSKWGTAGAYTFQTQNTTNGLNALDDIDDLYLDQVLSFVGMQVGEQRIIAMELSYTDTPSGTACIFCYGRNAEGQSGYALSITTSEGPQFLRRPKNGGSSGTTENINVSSGTFTQFKNQGRFAMVFGITVASASTVDLELQLGNGTLSAVYAETGIDLLLTGGTPPGVADGISMSDFGGLTLGARNAASIGTIDNFWGNSASGTSVGKIGNFQARKYTTYSATRAAEKLAKMLARPFDFVLED